ncbi:MAG: nucleotide-sugar epimerase [actinobacterium acIB-AMD-7]|nr:MAG: nucleotide-sugar epimerase [actinobacterium acIB-AMD-7]
MSKVIVTGGAGFIGSNLVDKLISDGHEVICLDNESSEVNAQFYWNSKAINVNVDIRNLKLIIDYFTGVDYVFHLAGQSRIQPSIINPLETLEINIMGTANVLEASRLKKIKKVIYSTTSSYYGLKNEVPNVETQSEDCLNPYSLSKVTGDKLCKIYSELYGLQTIVLRYFCVYGNREPLKGEFAPVIGLFLRQYEEGKPLTVVGDGMQIRDFTHIEDVIRANMLVMNASLVKSGEVYNVGSGSSLPILEIAQLISKNIAFIPPRVGEAKASMANTEKIRDHFGWKSEMDLKTYISQKVSQIHKSHE